MKTASIPAEQIEALVEGLQLSDGGAVSGTVQNGQLTLSVLDAGELAELKRSLDKAMAEEPKLLDGNMLERLKARAAAKTS